MNWIDAPRPLLTLAGYSDLLSAALLRRGIRTAEEARAFLDPASYTPTPASALPGMDSALERISAALRRRERICIWGDFDVDGQTATAILVETLRTLGADVTYSIPVRAREGHGVHLPRLKELIAQGVQLIITCDTGITAHQAVEYARSRGVDMVITDHHDLEETLPRAAAVTNPKLLPPEHPLAHLPGAGVAFKLAEALLETHSSDLQPETLLDLTALGIIADLATLRGDSRYLAQKGIQALRNTQRRGLKAMLELAELSPENLTETHISFTLAPRLNALGRLEDANPAVELLTTQDPLRARVLATHLEGLNAQRKLLCSQIERAAEAQLRQDPSLLAAPVLVLTGKEWPGGVLGIVASQMVERYGKPAILFSLGADGLARGSARSVTALHITQAIAAQSDLLHSFGGHPMAAGLALPAEHLGEFRKRLMRTAERMLAQAPQPEPALEIEAWLGLEEITLAQAAEIESLSPFGPGNPPILLATHSVRLESHDQVGKNGEHRRVTVSDEAGHRATVMWWSGGEEELPEGRFDLAYTLRTSDYKGQRQVSIEWVAFRSTQSAQITLKSPEVEVIDLRAEKQDPSSLLTHLSSFAPYQLWAEGEHKRTVNGQGRHELQPADTLVLWTTPPYGDVLRAVMAHVQPKKVILICQPPDWDFLPRLAGLVNYVLRQRAGRTSLTELAAATGERTKTVRLGLEYLSKRGQVAVRFEPGDMVFLQSAPVERDEHRAAHLKVAIEKMLQETAAYRRQFAQHPNPIEEL
ncbi:MAG: single-stranded-DNA-specific exonuclease RecJ [Anaerolineales bacterium]|nr:single-stranded-DNA-specific exonuclease RecJ [Anaerolineales bacterium]MDW8278248.1 single-stranded-DNA-specific exonuclease RecJ [Anaerolineales bacterium]